MLRLLPAWPASRSKRSRAAFGYQLQYGTERALRLAVGKRREDHARFVGKTARPVVSATNRLMAVQDLHDMHERHVLIATVGHDSLDCPALVSRSIREGINHGKRDLAFAQIVAGWLAQHLLCR